MAALFAVCFAMRIVLLRKAKRMLTTFDPLLVGEDDLWIVVGIAVVTAIFLAFTWSRMAYATFDEELARLWGIHVGWLESAPLAALAAVVVASIRLAGVVLVSAFQVIPSAVGRLVGRSLGGVAWWSIGAGVLGRREQKSPEPIDSPST